MSQAGQVFVRYDISFTMRDFSGPLKPKCELTIESLSWTAFGGCDWAQLKGTASSEELLSMFSYLRCGVQVSDENFRALWWGYIESIDIFLGKVKISLSLSQLYNRVKVRYSFLSPDNRLADEYQTAFVEDHQSQLEYGIKEHELQVEGIDDPRAEFLRDTFLSNHAWPVSELSQLPQVHEIGVQFHCSGWFHTLAWQNYANDNGFFANYGPGPGTHIFGAAGNSLYPAQSFQTKNASIYLTQVFFRLRVEGNPQKNIYVRLHADQSGIPGQVLSISDAIFSSFSKTSYDWVKFKFSTPYLLNANTRYWVSIDPNGLDGVNFFHIKLDENQPYAEGEGRYYDGSSWISFPSITTGTLGKPDTYFRIVCQNDTSAQLSDMVATGGQFINRIRIPSTGRQTSPYRSGGRTCLEEILDLMNLGSTNDRLILASVSLQRDLSFYEQPAPDTSDLFMDQAGQLFSSHGNLIQPGPSVVGRYARYGGTNRISLPWDCHRLPACFISGLVYYPKSDSYKLETF